MPNDPPDDESSKKPIGDIGDVDVLKAKAAEIVAELSRTGETPTKEQAMVLAMFALLQAAAKEGGNTQTVHLKGADGKTVASVSLTSLGKPPDSLLAAPNWDRLSDGLASMMDKRSMITSACAYTLIARSIPWAADAFRSDVPMTHCGHAFGRLVDGVVTLPEGLDVTDDNSPAIEFLAGLSMRAHGFDESLIGVMLAATRAGFDMIKPMVTTAKAAARQDVVERAASLSRVLEMAASIHPHRRLTKDSAGQWWQHEIPCPPVTGLTEPAVKKIEQPPELLVTALAALLRHLLTVNPLAAFTLFARMNENGIAIPNSGLDSGPVC